MTKNSKHIFVDTITREFIKFAKLMHIMPSIYKEYLRYCLFSCISGHQELFKKNSFYDYARYESKYYCMLNDGYIKRVYFFSDVYGKSRIKNVNELCDLFLSHLKDKGYPRYIKLIKYK